MTIRSPESSSVMRWPGMALTRGRGRGRRAGRAARSRSRSRHGRRRRRGRGRGRGRRGRCGRRRARPRGRSLPPPPIVGSPVPTEASSSLVLPAMSGSSARRRPMRPRSLSTSTTRTAISSPLLSTSSTVPTRLPGDTLEMCSRPSVPLASSTKAPKVVVLTTLPCELVADLDLLGHRADALDQGVALGAGDGVDEDHALVVDVDLGLVLLLQGANRLAALADEQADLLRIDLDRADPRGVLGELLARGVDRLVHLAEDELATFLGLGERVAHDLERDARDLDVHLQGGDALRRCPRP